MKRRLYVLAAVGLVLAATVVLTAQASPTGNSGSASAQCLTDDGAQSSNEPSEAPEYSTITVSPTTLWPPNHRLQTVTLTMNFTDDEPDSATLTVLSITSDQGSSADWSGVGNSATGPADGSDITTSVQVRAERNGASLAGRTYSIMVQCADGGTPPQAQNTVTVQVNVPHDQNPGQQCVKP